MTTDDLAGILREHRSYTEHNHNLTEAGYFTCSCGEVILTMSGFDEVTVSHGATYVEAKLAAHQAAVIAAAGWVKGREEWAVKHHGYGNAAHYEPCADEEGARRRAALSAWSGYVEPTPVRRYVTEWEPA